jgi:hypothetical protein
MIKAKNNLWMAGGIKISCQHKTGLYLTLMNSHDPDLKYYYKTCCKILANVIKATKNLHCKRLTSNSSNKIKTTCSIIKSVTGIKINNAGIQFLNIDGKLTDNHHMITES